MSEVHIVLERIVLRCFGAQAIEHQHHGLLGHTGDSCLIGRSEDYGILRRSEENGMLYKIDDSATAATRCVLCLDAHTEAETKRREE